MILLNSKYLLALNPEKESPLFQRIRWLEKVDHPERCIFVSTDQKLIATQHSYAARDKHNRTRIVCCFDVRHLQTGKMLGQVNIVCPQDEKSV